LQYTGWSKKSCTFLIHHISRLFGPPVRWLGFWSMQTYNHTNTSSLGKQHAGIDGPISGADDEDVLCRVDAVHLSQQLCNDAVTRPQGCPPNSASRHTHIEASSSAHNMTLPASAAIDRYAAPAGHSAANQPDAAAAVDRRDRQTDNGPLRNTAVHTMRKAPSASCYDRLATGDRITAVHSRIKLRTSTAYKS